MAGSYKDILKEWERTTANPVIYDNLDLLFPAFSFRRIQAGGENDRWVSHLKLDLSLPKRPSKEKTVVYRREFCLREQGDWDNRVSIIERYMEDHGHSTVYEAYREIAERFRLDMPSPQPVSSSASRKDRILLELEKYFKWNLWNNRGAACVRTLDYLRSGRGFNDEQIQEFGFGFVPSWDKVEAFITSPRMGYTKEELDSACPVLNEEGRTSIGSKHVLAIPYRCSGVMKGFLFRAVDNDVTPKYKACRMMDRSSSFFNIPAGRNLGEIVVMEGEMDALTATAAGIKGAVSIGGSDISGERSRQIYDAFNRNVTRITLCPDLDTDAEGLPNNAKRFKCVRRTLHTIFGIRADFNEVYVAEFPVPSDPDEYIRKHGAAAFRKMLDSAKPWWKYISDYMESL